MNDAFISAGSPEPDVYSVTAVLDLHDEAEANARVSLPDVWVQGEIERLNRDADHAFFRIRDERSQMHAVAFKYHASCLPPSLQEGAEAQIRGTVKRYARGGYRQIEVRQVRVLGGAPAWQTAGEALEATLASEGLLLPSRRRAIPRFPRAVGVVAAPTSAAWRDVLSVIEARAPWIRVVLSPAQTQGEGAPESIAAAIRRFAQHRCDVVIVARGGGSSADLGSFDTEIVARAVAECPIPVITAIGHAPDLTRADRVADRACITPSMAAVEVTPEPRDALLRSVEDSARCLGQSIRRALHDVKERLRDAELVLARRRVGYAEHDAPFHQSNHPSGIISRGYSPNRVEQPMRTSLFPLPDVPPLDSSLMRLEQIVTRLQGEALPLDEHLALVQDGWAHAHAIRQTIQAATLTVDHLVESVAGTITREHKSARSLQQGGAT